MHKSPSRFKLTISIVYLIVANSIVLTGFVSTSIFYALNIILHLFLGLWLLPLGAMYFYKSWQQRTGKSRHLISISSGLFLLASISGVAIIYLGNYTRYRWLLNVHIVSSVLCLTIVFFSIGKSLLSANFRPLTRRIAGVIILVLAVTAIVYSTTTGPWDVINNDAMSPENMAGETPGGEGGDFFPSPSETSDGKLIPETFFMDSQGCGISGCHVDIVKQWETSAHRFSSFNNQYYRKSIEYMQEMTGTRKALWCSGCHDPALLFSGQMDQPVSAFLDQPAAHAGIGCVGCHSIVSVKNTRGNGGYVIEYPPLHELVTSSNRFVRIIHDFIVKVNPEPHRRSFIKPFHTEQTAEFCATCHKVSLDAPVNNYRWIRGFNTYDNWQASGVSGQGARSFYEPASPRDCADCHMPVAPAVDVYDQIKPIASHRFLAANTALPVANSDTTQLQMTAGFLKSGQLTVDNFALSMADKPTASATGTVQESAGLESPRPTSTFAAGEESGFAVGSGGIFVEPDAITAPLRDAMPVLQRGRSARLDVIVRTRGLGHFFPTGTVDAQEAWLEVQVSDSDGRLIFQSGGLLPDGLVEPGAHFYRNRLLDAQGNLINKRNAWAARSVLYVNLIPPGAADVAHYRIHIPENCSDTVTVVTRLNYRKFDQWHNQWAYAGRRDSTQKDLRTSLDYDNGYWNFDGDLNAVSGALKAIPQLPIVVMAVDTLLLSVTDAGQVVGQETAHSIAPDRERWNDYGIGLLRNGDLRGAERAFRMVTELAPDYTDGWINLSRVYLREGNLEKAEVVLATAETSQPGFHKTQFFRGLLLKAKARYPAALQELYAVSSRFPTDRVVLNQIGRIYYLDARPGEAIAYFKRVLQIDSEDLMAHYNLMLCYRAVGDMTMSAEHEKRYLRYKADESAGAIAQEYRRSHPHDNNESQPIHEHASMIILDD